MIQSYDGSRHIWFLNQDGTCSYETFSKRSPDDYIIIYMNVTSSRCYKLFKFPTQITTWAYYLEYKVALKGVEIKYTQLCARYINPV